MTDTPEPAPAAAPGAGKEVALHKIFVQDISWEVPKGPSIFTRKWEPKVDLAINTAVSSMEQGTHLVTLTATVTANLEDDVAYIAEVQQCGIIGLAGIDNDDERRAVLGAYVPNLLFPFCREAVADLIQRGGFPQFLLQPVDFNAVYQQHVTQNAPAAETKH